MSAPRITIAAISDSLEAHALREAFEQFDAVVNRVSVGRPQHFVDIIRNPQSEYLVLSCHGDENGVVFPELDEELARNEPFGVSCTPAEITRYAQLDQQLVLSTGCMSGTDPFAEAYLAAGARAYIAPRGYPDGNSAFFFTVQLFYGLLVRGLPLDEAMRWCRSTDNECERFHYWAG